MIWRIGQSTLAGSSKESQQIGDVLFQVSLDLQETLGDPQHNFAQIDGVIREGWDAWHCESLRARRRKGGIDPGLKSRTPVP